MNTWSLSLNNLASLPPPPSKVCRSCNASKPIGEFYVMGGRISYFCKVCHKEAVYAKRRKVGAGGTAG
jgi:hypothetical protein